MPTTIYEQTLYTLGMSVVRRLQRRGDSESRALLERLRVDGESNPTWQELVVFELASVAARLVSDELRRRDQ